MQDLSIGYQFLENGEWAAALAYFNLNATLYADEFDTLNACRYGQARALMGSSNLDQAKAILLDLIKDTPRWDAPYITLARVYEKEGILYQRVGNETAAKGAFKKAEETFLSALNHTKRSKRLTENFEYFLREHFAPWENANTFLPAFQMSATTSPAATVSSPQPLSPRSHSSYTKAP